MEKSYRERENFLNRRLYSNKMERKNVLNMLFFLFVLVIGHSLSAQTYCVPSNTNSSSYYISSVKTIGALQDINKTIGFSANGYGDYTATDTVIVYPGQTITFEATHPSSTYAYNMWVDWDKNGDFLGVNENVLTTGSSYVTSPVSTSLTIPLIAPLGVTRLRIRNAYLSAPAPSCGSHNYGETEDYIIKVVQLNSCAGQPFAGTVITGTPVCSNTPFNIKTNGVVFEDGLTGVWQSSPAGANTWSDIFGATSTNYTVAGGIIVATDYRYIITCANSSLSDTTGVISVTLKAGNECYCIPTYSTGCSDGDEIENVTLNGETINLNNSSFCSGGYSDFTAVTPPDLAPGGIYSISVTNTSSYSNDDDVRIWIDYNNNGVFEPSEEIANTNGNGLINDMLTASFTIPSSLASGNYTMRVRMIYAGGSTIDPCSSASYGETEDYTVNIIQLNNCVGIPDAGMVTSPISICGGIDFTISTANSSPAADGLIGQWQSSPAGANTWTDITGATSTSYNVVGGASANTDYRFILTCTHDNNNADTTSIIAVTLKTAAECYCTPSNTYSSSYYISSVKTTGAIQDVNRTSGFSPNGYGDYTATDTLVVYLGQTVSLEATHPSSTYTYDVWIDWDADGSFTGPNENVLSTNGNYINSPIISSLTIPLTAPIGATRLRIRNAYLSGPAPSCGSHDYGETEDYIIKVIQLDPCAGQPTAGAISPSVAICSGIDFTVQTTGATLEDGITGIWQSSPAGANTWTDITGATTSSYTLSGGINTATDYRYIVTCANSSLADTSNVLSVTMKPGNQCYCIPTGNSSSYYVNNFSTTGGVLNISNLGSGYSTGGYGDFTATDTVSQVRTLAVNFSSAYGGSNTFGTKVWVDWNQDGLFDATEIVYQSTSYANSVTGSFTVPNTAVLGSTRMRIGISYTPNSGPASACEAGLSGEYEDYIFKVLPLAECAGTPTAGTIGSSITICSGTDFTVSTTGISSPANNLSGIWQSSPAGANTWTNIPGATSASYTIVGGIMSSKDYRYVITCANNSSSDTSGVLSVTLKSANECYCIPTYTSNCTLNDVINNVTLNGVSINLNNNSSCGAGGYNDFTTVAAPDLSSGSSYTISVTNNTTRAPEDDVRIWIDWNQNGTFENSEVIASTNGGGLVNNTLAANFTVPTGQTSGNYRMRVRLVYHGGTYISPCSNEIYGETEDYTVKIVAPCTNPVVYLGADKLICSGASVTLDAGNSGLTYLWNDGSTNKTLVVTAPGTYSVTVTNGACSASDNILVSNYPAPTADSIVAVNNGSCQFDFSLANAQNVTGYKWSFGDGSATVNTASPSHTFTTDGSYNISVTIANNCNDTTTITKTIICNTLGIKDATADNNNFRLYPNPSSSDVTIEVSGIATMESVTIIDNVGKVVFYGTPNDTTKYSIDVSKLSNGLYTALIRTNKGMATKKFEVSK